MQSELDDGTSLYSEYTDPSGFIMREIPRSTEPVLKYQAGRYALRTMSLPVYQKDRMTHHVQGDEIRVFHLLGFAETRAKALDRASNLLFRQELENKR